MKTNKFSALQLNKKSIAKLNDGQLTSVKGGNRGNQLEADCTNGGITCSTAGSTVIIKDQVS
ncbi:rSAM-modified peptide [Chryseobacterium piperi]|uniref:class I lanthipeptide n=1 Tax=Chryseobacterium piperi TaxID=558152 RepID=UPI000BAADB93|nr:class I lanthipeptide [Chryseobacterium piperi]ASW75611.1 rSAM-modified peptide [Chryseobacterium piperi]